jgi:hypothetical protein
MLHNAATPLSFSVVCRRGCRGISDVLRGPLRQYSRNTAESTPEKSWAVNKRWAVYKTGGWTDHYAPALDRQRHPEEEGKREPNFGYESRKNGALRRAKGAVSWGRWWRRRRGSSNINDRATAADDPTESQRSTAMPVSGLQPCDRSKITLISTTLPQEGGFGEF